MPTRYAHVNIMAADWKRLCDFYEQVFDCEPVSSERDHHGPHIDALTGETGQRFRGRHMRVPGHGKNGPTIEIFSTSLEREGSPKRLTRPGFSHVAFEVDDIESKRAQVKSLGGDDYGELVTIDIPGAGTLTLLYMSDPEGNIVELQKWTQ